MGLTEPIVLLAFLPLVLAAMAVLPRAARAAGLLAASLAFYALADPRGWPFLLLFILANYGLGRLIGTAAPEARRRLVAIGVCADICALAYAKYTGLLCASLGLDATGIAPAILPLGISFFTFSAVAYLVDVGRGTHPAEANLVRFGLFLAFFPKITAGPIARYSEMAGDFDGAGFGLPRFAEGVRRFAQGLAKKVLIAGTVAPLADYAFGLDPARLDAGTALGGILAYAVQIYFDFSGYTDMAVGLGLMCGYALPENFRHPYVARSVQEFWRRWHMTLSAWFRDYLYIPLGGNRVPPWRVHLNLLAVFGLCGLWHGASWSFLVWGLWHGGFLILERTGFGTTLAASPRPLRHAYLLAAVLGGWVFFRAPTLAAALGYFGGFTRWSAEAFAYTAMTYGTHQILLALAAAVLFAMPVGPFLAGRLGKGALSARLAPAADVAAVACLLALGMLQALAGGHTPFIYAKF